MKPQGPSNKVIHLTTRIADKKPVTKKKEGQSRKPHTRVIAITSGKGGVGKSNIVANLGFVLSRLGKRVLILDADLGLGNLDVLLGLAPKYNLSHAISGENRLGNSHRRSRKSQDTPCSFGNSRTQRFDG